MKHFVWSFVLLLFCCKSATHHHQANSNNVGAPNDTSRFFVVASYNVENLFDTINDLSNEGDDETLPTSKKKWNTERYNKKLSDIAKVLASAKTGYFPAIVGLCEIENAEVVKDLANVKILQPANYQVVHEQSPDERGVDVALMYSANQFKYIKHQAINVDLGDDKTRDILYLQGTTMLSDTLHVFVNHWPSRRNDSPALLRIKAAKTLRSKIDQILQSNSQAKIICMGDFNDEPADSSVFIALNATGNKTGNYSELYNLMYDLDQQKKGTHVFKNQWFMLDNLIVSRGLLNKTQGWYVSFDGGSIFDASWVLYTNKDGQTSPNRTYGGDNYYGGYSDHLMLYMVMQKI